MTVIHYCKKTGFQQSNLFCSLVNTGCLFHRHVPLCGPADSVCQGSHSARCRQRNKILPRATVGQVVGSKGKLAAFERLINAEHFTRL